MDFASGRHVFIVNPAAGKGTAGNFIREAVEPYFKANGGAYEVFETKAPGDAAAFAKREAQAAQAGDPVTLYACGGDGTFNELVQGVYGYENTRITPIPLGSGNDFVKSFGGAGPFLNIDALVKGETLRLDLMHCNDMIAINLCSMGFDAWACYMVQIFKKWPLVTGQMSYHMGVAYSLINKMKNQFVIHIDGQKVAEGGHLLAIAANCKWYGGSYMAAPDADPTDGQLDFLYVPAMSRRKFLSIVRYYKSGEHEKLGDTVHHLRGREMRVQSEKPFAVSVDGEVISTADVHFSIEPAAIQVVLPAKLANNNKIERESLLK